MGEPFVCVVNLGCRVNRAESDRIVSEFARAGAAVVDADDADLIVINTCAVTGEAEAKTRKAVRHALARRRAPLVVAAALLLLVLFFYGPVKGLYQAWRTEGIRQAQLSGLTEENDSYQQDIDRLQTREGVEDEARRRGYVAEGETSIVVEGLDTSEDAQEEGTSETPWYLRVTDTIFQYEEP